MLVDVSTEKQDKKHFKGRTYPTSSSKKKARDAKRQKEQNTPACKRLGLLYVQYSIWWATEDIYISQTKLGALVGVNRDTCRKHLRMLVADGWLGEWQFRLYDTCIYNLGKNLTRQQIAYKFRGIKRPKGFKVPGWLFGLIMRYLPQAQAYALLKYGITHESFLKKGNRDKKYTENRKKRERKLLKSKFGVPDPRLTKVLIDKYNLKQQQAEFLARNEERTILLAIEDLDTYISKFSKVVNNPFGFLLHRCKAHGSKAYQERRKVPEKVLKTPQDRLGWLKEYLSSIQKKVFFINSERQVNRRAIAETTKPGILLKIHKQDPAKSSLKVFQKVCGTWVDKVFTFERPDLVNDVETYLENSLKQVK